MKRKPFGRWRIRICLFHFFPDGGSGAPSNCWMDARAVNPCECRDADCARAAADTSPIVARCSKVVKESDLIEAI